MSDLFKNDENLVKKASYLKFLARELADSLKTGNFRSLFRGQGIEFEGVRDYIRGDDVRSIDWNVTARMGHPFVKVFEEERELDVFIIVDKSLSMNTGSGIQSRLETAMDCASLITMASLHNGSPVGSVIFDGKIEFSVCLKHTAENIIKAYKYYLRSTLHSRNMCQYTQNQCLLNKNNHNQKQQR